MVQPIDLNQPVDFARAHLPQSASVPSPAATASLESDGASDALLHTGTNDTVSSTDSTSPNTVRVTCEKTETRSKLVPQPTERESTQPEDHVAVIAAVTEDSETDKDDEEEATMLPSSSDHNLSLGVPNDNGMFLKPKTAVRRAVSNSSVNQPVTSTSLTHHATRTLIWISLAALVALGVSIVKGKDHAIEFITAYIVEYSLSVDNLFVFLLIFRFFNVPAAPQQSILTYGIIGAMVLRGVMIVCGKALVQRFEWVGLLFAALLIYSAGKLLFEDDDDETDLSDNRIIRFARSIMPVSERYAGDRFFIWENGRLMATPLMVVLVSIEFSDVVFAVDSVPAVLALSSDTFVIYMSNILAIMGLRSLFFVLATSIGSMRFLKQALAITLAFIGIKMIAGCFEKDFGTTFSLCFIALTLAGGVILSIMLPGSAPIPPLPTSIGDSAAAQVVAPPLHKSASGSVSHHSRANSESVVDNV